MKKLILTLLLLSAIITPQISRADDTALTKSLFEAGNAAYESGQWSTAIEKYNQALKMNQGNHVLYYNLGNAYFKKDEIGQAIYAYQKALRLAPRSKSIQENLALARLRTKDKISEPDLGFVLTVIKKIHQAVSPNELVLLISLLWLTTCSFLALRIYLDKPIINLTTVILVCVLLLPVISLSAKVYQYEILHQAVIIDKECEVYSGPGKNYKKTFSLHEGTTVRVEQQRNHWSEISVGTNLKGWVDNKTLCKL